MLGNERLDEERAPLRVEPGRYPVGCHVVRMRHDGRGVGIVAGERVPVGNEVEAVVLILKRRPVVEGADEMPEVQLARRTHTRDDAWFHSWRSLKNNLVGGRISCQRIPLNIRA